MNKCPLDLLIEETEREMGLTDPRPRMPLYDSQGNLISWNNGDETQLDQLIEQNRG